MDKNYDSILVFDRPITLRDNQNNDWLAYGYVYDSTICFADEYDYVRYLVGLEKWFAMGNHTELNNTWIDSKTGTIYEDKDEYIKEFCWEAFDDNPVSFFSKKDITFSLPKDSVEDSFIISENFWRVALNMILDLNIAEQKAPKQETIENNNGGENEDLPF